MQLARTLMPKCCLIRRLLRKNQLKPLPSWWKLKTSKFPFRITWGRSVDRFDWRKLEKLQAFYALTSLCRLQNVTDREGKEELWYYLQWYSQTSDQLWQEVQLSILYVSLIILLICLVCMYSTSITCLQKVKFYNWHTLI